MNLDGRGRTRASPEVSVTCRDALTWTVADDAGVTRNEKVIGSIPIGGSNKSPGQRGVLASNRCGISPLGGQDHERTGHANPQWAHPDSGRPYRGRLYAMRRLGYLLDLIGQRVMAEPLHVLCEHRRYVGADTDLRCMAPVVRKPAATCRSYVGLPGPRVQAPPRRRSSAHRRARITSRPRSS